MLHSDIFPFFLRYLSPDDLLATSDVCRALREPALMEFLSRHIAFRTLTDVDVLCQSMRARLGEPWPSYLRNITVSFHNKPEPESATTMQNVLDMFQRASRLRRLVVSRADRILCPKTGIPAAISALEHLKDFYVKTESGGVQATVADLLAGTPSRLTSLRLREGGSRGEWTYTDLPRMLRPHLHHLTSLTLASCMYLTPDIRCATLISLAIALDEQPPRLHLLREAFPNLQKLTILNRIPDNLFLGSEHLGRLREERMARQVDGHVWSSLVTVEGGVLQLYLLGFACRSVSRLVLRDCKSQYHSAAAELVRCASPSFLRLHTYCYPEYRHSEVDSLLIHGTLAAPSYVTHLTMDITIDRVGLPKAEDFATHIVRTISSSKLECLHVILGRETRRIRDDLILGAHFRLDPCTASSLQALDIDSLCREVVETGQSLRLLAFTIACRERHLVWTIDRTSGAPRMTQLDAAAARAVIQREQL